MRIAHDPMRLELQHAVQRACDVLGREITDLPPVSAVLAAVQFSALVATSGLVARTGELRINRGFFAAASSTQRDALVLEAVRAYCTWARSARGTDSSGHRVTARVADLLADAAAKDLVEPAAPSTMPHRAHAAAAAELHALLCRTRAADPAVASLSDAALLALMMRDRR